MQVKPIDTSAPIHRSFFNSERVDLIKQVAKKTLIEAVVLGAIVGITSAFVLPGMVYIMIVATAIVLTINVLVRLGIAELTYRQRHNPTEAKKNIIKALNWIAPCSFSVVASGTIGTVVHETGHKVAAELFYKNPNPRITVIPFNGGFTQYTLRGFSNLGAKLGFTTTDILTTAAGSIAAVGVSTGLLIAGFATETSYPELSKYFIVSAIISIAEHIFYALSALWTSPVQLGHDFVALSLYGISPVACAVTMGAIPLVVKGLFALGSLVNSYVIHPSKHNNVAHLQAV